MKKLSEKEYWDSIYKHINLDEVGSESKFSYIKNKIKFITRDYSNFILWEVLCKKYLPYDKSKKIIEIGCAPGKYLINLSYIFGYEPYGVEYSEKGVDITKENFKKWGLDENNIIKADFFNKDFQENNAGKYDVVFSRGFIEHFDNVQSVVDLHSNILKNNGYLVIMIPNLNGVNKVLAKFLNKSSYDLHNISIMNKKSFSGLFSEEDYSINYCDYVGLFSFGLFNTDKKWKYYLYRFLLLVQRPFDLLFRIIFRDRVFTNKYTSPYLLCIAQKR